MNAYAILNLPPGLVFSDEDLANAYREAGKVRHPDAGGNPEDFAALREAFAILSSPSRRLRHWLERTGKSMEIRGTIDDTLMELFGEVGTVNQNAETLIRKRDAATSALGRAMLENEIQQCREHIESLIQQLDGRIEKECEPFPEWEKENAAPDLEQCGLRARNLAFLEKWKSSLRGNFSRLV